MPEATICILYVCAVCRYTDQIVHLIMEANGLNMDERKPIANLDALALMIDYLLFNFAVTL